MEKLTNEVTELPERVDMLIMDLNNTTISFQGPKGNPGLRPGVRNFLNYHKTQGIPVVISSDAREESIEYLLKSLGVNKYFDGIYGEEHMIDACSKDISRICREQGVAPERVLMVGDIPGIDGASAQRAGAQYLAVPMPHRDKSFTYDKFLKNIN